MTNGMTAKSPGTSWLGGGTEPSRRLGRSALGATQPSANSFIGQQSGTLGC
jgi:hypothetical protein